MLTIEQARNNIQGVIDQLRLTKPERDTLDTSLRLLYDAAVEDVEAERELKSLQADLPQPKES